MQRVQYIESNCDQGVPTRWALLWHSFSRNSNDRDEPCQNSLKLDLLNLTRVNELPVLNLTSDVRRMWPRRALALSRLQETIHCQSSQPSAASHSQLEPQLRCNSTHGEKLFLVVCLSSLFQQLFLEAGQELLFSKTFMLKTIIKWAKYLHKECYCINQSWWGVQYPCKTQKNTFWNIIITIYITKCIGVLEKTGSFDIITLNWRLILKSCYLWVTGFHPKKSHLVARFLSTRGLLKRSAHVSLDVKFFTVAFQHIL